MTSPDLLGAESVSRPVALETEVCHLCGGSNPGFWSIHLSECDSANGKHATVDGKPSYSRVRYIAEDALYDWMETYAKACDAGSMATDGDLAAMGVIADLRYWLDNLKSA